MSNLTYRKIVWWSVVVFLTFSFPVLCSVAEHVNPNCCRYPAQSSGIKIQSFLESCAAPGETARGMIPYFDCQSYVLGVIDTYRQLNPSIRKSKKIYLPSSITTKDVLELIWNKYPNWEIPETRQASEVIIEVLQKRYPCEK